MLHSYITVTCFFCTGHRSSSDPHYFRKLEDSVRGALQCKTWDIDAEKIKAFDAGELLDNYVCDFDDAGVVNFLYKGGCVVALGIKIRVISDSQHTWRTLIFLLVHFKDTHITVKLHSSFTLALQLTHESFMGTCSAMCPVVLFFSTFSITVLPY